jgi:DNA polymerase I-like protein with 3'-5' exonuclease and polymerase domains
MNTETGFTYQLGKKLNLRMNYQVLDVETTTFAKGNPFSRRNKLIVVGIGDYMGLDKTEIQSRIDNTQLLVGFNIKFDLHHIKNYEIDFSRCAVWDCQLAAFLLSGQSTPYPSLNSVSELYGLGSKLDVVSTEYWDKGIDTDDIPQEVLYEYLQQDLLLTEQVYLHQVELFKQEPQLYKLFRLQCQDLLVLQEMEYNGMFFDTGQAEILAKKEEERVLEIEKELQKDYEGIPINFQSRDHLSAYLYGGTIVHEERMPIGVYKTGAKTGLPRYKLIEYKYDLPQLIKPPKGSELKKEGYYATDEGTLRSISCNKQARRRLDLILERSQSSKLIGTYYRGLPELIREMDWPDNTLHGTFNQCVAATGRLSSSRPNLQNFAESVDRLLGSRYE